MPKGEREKGSSGESDCGQADHDWDAEPVIERYQQEHEETEDSVQLTPEDREISQAGKEQEGRESEDDKPADRNVVPGNLKDRWEQQGE